MNQPVVNFSAGPAMLPAQVLQEVQQQLCDWHKGMSVLEVSHRSKPVLALKANLDRLLRSLLNIPDHFKILLMHGGARAQFSAIPLNLLNNKRASYLITGHWGRKALEAAKAYGDPDVIELGGDFDINAIPSLVDSQSAYLHVTDNETIEGVELIDSIDSGCPIVIDATSSILSKPINWDPIGCVYASFQKNLGIAGATLVCMREDLIRGNTKAPDTLNYAKCLESDSMYNTPPVFSWYVAEKILQWVEAQGGVQAMQALAMARSQLLYDTIDTLSCFSNTIPAHVRSRMNIPFLIHQSESSFFAEAEKAQLYFLKGHRSVGGARASMYNAMPLDHVQCLVDFMQAFDKKVA